MIGFQRGANGLIRLELTSDEKRVLRDLTEQLPAVLASGHGDPAVGRMLPDGYLDDEEAAAEFRNFTQAGLIERKLANARTVGSSLQSETVELNADAVGAWLRTLTDLRTIVATRLGIEKDGDAGEPNEMLRTVYDWLGYLQESLVQAITR